MSNFLSASENVAGQRQNIRFEKDGGRKKSGLAGVGESLFVYFWFVLYRKNVSVTVRQLYLNFWYHCDALTLDSVVMWSLMMR